MPSTHQSEIALLKEENEKLKDICKRYKLIIEGSNDGIWEWDIENDIYTVSLRDQEFFDYNQMHQSLKINDWKNLLHPEDIEKSINNLTDFISGKNKEYRNVYRMVDKEGKSRWILSKGKGIKNSEGKITHIAGSHTDITEKLEMEKELYELAYSDYLTKLSNREKMFRDFKDLVKDGAENIDIAFFYIDIDEFGFINNTLGYEEGNRIIKKTARYLEKRYGDNGYIARISADEFLVMYIKDEEQEDIEVELKNLLMDIKKINFFENHELFLTVSIGAAIYDRHGLDFFDLIRKADTALYCAKKNGKDQFHIYSPQMEEKVYSNIELVNQIRIGIEKKEFEMYYQPVFEARTGRFAGLEALIRWNHPFKGIVSPMDFIPAAEASGQMVSLEKLIFENVFSQLRKWIDKGEMPIFVAINLSAKGLLESGIVQYLEYLLEKYKIKPGKIEFEVTETAMINNMEQAMDVLGKIRDLGFKISMDDFGKGYSSLNYLSKLPIDKVKLDKDFVDEIESSKGELLINSIIDLSQKLNLEVVAEGVEKEEEKLILEKMNCNYLQGFLFAKPKTVADLEQWIREFYKIK